MTFYEESLELLECAVLALVFHLNVNIITSYKGAFEGLARNKITGKFDAGLRAGRYDGRSLGGAGRHWAQAISRDTPECGHNVSEQRALSIDRVL